MFMSSTHPIRWKYLLLIPGILIIGLVTGCRIEQEEAGKLPEVDVDVEPAELPEYEIEGPEVEVGSQEAEITVPDVDVDVSTEDKTIEVPTIDVEPPQDDAQE